MTRRPDLGSIGGIATALVCILVGQMLEGGHPSSVMQVTAALIVFGGTLGAVMVAFSLEDVKGGFLALKDVFGDATPHHEQIIKQLVEFGQIARREGMLALEAKIAKSSDPFLATALGLAVDGADPKLVREVLEVAIDTESEKAKRHAKVFESAGGFSPTVGILGAVLGLIHVMENLTDPGKMGGGIATAFVATVYGVAAANLFFLPAANKLKLKHEEVALAKTLVLEGVLAIQSGENPRLIEERLWSYLPESKRGPRGETAAKKAA